MKTKVLAMDDSLTVRSVIESTLKNDGYDVYVVSNGEEGIQKAEEISPDVILVDFVMPKMNGYQVCKKLRSEQQFEQTPIILITARGEEVGKTFSDKFNVSYFVKPFRPTELLAKLEEVTKRSEKNKLSADEILPEETQTVEELSSELEAADTGEPGLVDLSEELSLPDIAGAPSPSDAPEDLDQLLNDLSSGDAIESQGASLDDAMAALTESEPQAMHEMPNEPSLDSIGQELPSHGNSASVEQVKSSSQYIDELKEDNKIETSFDDLSLPSGSEEFDLPDETKSEELQLEGSIAQAPEMSPVEGAEPYEGAEPHEEAQSDELVLDDDAFEQAAEMSLAEGAEPHEEAQSDELVLDDDAFAQAPEMSPVEGAEPYEGAEPHEEAQSDELVLDDAFAQAPEMSLSADSLSNSSGSPEVFQADELQSQSSADETLILAKGNIELDKLLDEKEEKMPGIDLSDDLLNIQNISADTVSAPPVDNDVTEAKADITSGESSDAVEETFSSSKAVELPVENKGISSEEHNRGEDSVIPLSNAGSEYLKNNKIASQVSEVVSRYLINYFESNFLERIEQSLTNNINKYFIGNTAAKLPLSGNFSHFPLSSILKVLLETRLKGVLNIFSTGQFAEIYVANGRIVSANSNKKTKWSFIGQVLKKESKITEVQLTEALEKSIAEKLPLGKVLIEKGFVSADDIKLVLKRQVIAVVHSLIESKKGKFFFEETVDEEKFSDMPLNLSYNDVISSNPENEEMSKESSEEWRLVYQRINGKDTYVGVISDFDEVRKIGLKADELKIFSYLDGTKDLDTVVKLSRHSYFDVYKTIYGLIKQGLIKNLTEGE